MCHLWWTVSSHLVDSFIPLGGQFHPSWWTVSSLLVDSFIPLGGQFHPSWWTVSSLLVDSFIPLGGQFHPSWCPRIGSCAAPFLPPCLAKNILLLCLMLASWLLLRQLSKDSGCAPRAFFCGGAIFNRVWQPIHFLQSVRKVAETVVDEG